MERYIVDAVELATQRKVKLTIEADEAETSENIALRTEIDNIKLSSCDYNYQPAYQNLRDKVLKLGYGIKCNGSRLNVIQSGMMGSNTKLYLVEIGKPALNKNVVCLYGYADINLFPNTVDQTEFSEKWISSLSGSDQSWESSENEQHSERQAIK